MQKLSYLFPSALVGVLVWWGKPSWWAIAMLTGGSLFVWDYLWGERRVLDGRQGLELAAWGAALVAVALGLAWNLGMSLQEFQAEARGLRRREGFIFTLPSIGIGMALYGSIVWSWAFSRERE